MLAERSAPWESPLLEEQLSAASGEADARRVQKAAASLTGLAIAGTRPRKDPVIARWQAANDAEQRDYVKKLDRLRIRQRGLEDATAALLRTAKSYAILAPSSSMNVAAVEASKARADARLEGRDPSAASNAANDNEIALPSSGSGLSGLLLAAGAVAVTGLVLARPIINGIDRLLGRKSPEDEGGTLSPPSPEYQGLPSDSAGTVGAPAPRPDGTPDPELSPLRLPVPGTRDYPRRTPGSVVPARPGSNGVGWDGPIGAGAGSSANAATALAFFLRAGWTRPQAAGIVGNLQEESGPNLNPSAVGDGGKAIGIAQWHPDRRANFPRAIGKTFQQSGFTDQLAFVQWELTHTESRAGDRLRSATSAADAAVIVDKFYERSSGAVRGKRVANAVALDRGRQAAPVTAPPPSRKPVPSVPAAPRKPSVVPGAGKPRPSGKVSQEATAAEARQASRSTPTGTRRNVIILDHHAPSGGSPSPSRVVHPSSSMSDAEKIAAARMGVQ